MQFIRSTVKVSKLMLFFPFSRTAQNNNRDLYEILGVSRDCDQKQLKKAYYKLAQEHHPDKNDHKDSKNKFAQINNAYEILSDPNKRQVYDQTGSTQQHPGFEGASGFNPQDLFNQFKARDMGGSGGGMFQDILKDLFGGGGQKSQAQPQDSVLQLTLQFLQSVHGANKTIEYKRTQICSNCKGSKCKPGSKPEKCQNCKGSGTQRIKHGMYIMQTTCNSCNGQGQFIRNFCGTCNGEGIVSKSNKVQVTIPRGINDGGNIRLKGKGNFSADLILQIKIRKNNKFTRQGNNVYSQVEVPVLDAILGNEISITNIYNEKKVLKIKPGIQPGQKVTLQREGFYVPNSTQKGDHIITIKIVLPKVLSNQEKSFYEQIRSLK